MIDLTFEIVKNEIMASDIFEMTLKTDKLPADVKAGQFANVKVPNRTDLILRRPFGIYSVNFNDNTIKLGYALRGQGTQALSILPVGTKVQVLLPLGNGFPVVEDGKKVLLVGGGIEKGETHLECLKREFLEESGYYVQSADELVCVDCFWMAGGVAPMESKANIYVVKVDPENFTTPTEDGHTVHWAELDKALDLLPLPYHKVGLHYYLTKYNKNK